jgi:23S rRNA (pseudouridine1915-N3)-methyltransferase
LKITVIVIGKTVNGFISQGIDEYMKRLKRYIKTEFVVLPDIKNSKNLSIDQLMIKEEELLLDAIGSQSDIFLLDEQGLEYSSVELSQFIQGKMISGSKELTFIIGGAYGVTKKVKQRAMGMIALSRLTFSHQMVRLILAEQIYRAMTIIKGEPYHHQ